jgi:hypothetical protein
MSGEEKTPVPPELEAAYRAERARPGLDPAAERAIRDAVRKRLGAPAGPEGGSGAAGGGGGAPRPGAAGAAAAGFGALVASGLVGVVLGALGHAALTGTAPFATAAAPPAAAPSAVVAARSEPDTRPDPARAAEDRAAASAREDVPTAEPGAPRPPRDGESAREDSDLARTGSPGPEAEEGSDLAAERRLIDAARADVAEGRFEPALAGLAAHRRRFPAGALAEDRDALAIEALVGAGRLTEAGRAAGTFEREHPSSLLRGRVRALAAAAVP